jgi:protein arginine kinase
MWTQQTDEKSDVVLSSRIRLARNINEIPFPPLLGEEKAAELLNMMEEALRGSGYNLIRMKDIDAAKRLMLVERRVISREILNKETAAVFLSEDESISIMVNEEDHIRIQTICGGLSIDNAYSMAEGVDDYFSQKLNYAYDEQLGFLTSCPTNTGIGMRASVMLHLPFLTINNSMEGVIQAAGKFGLTVRGIYGEGSAAKGCIYQISNQVTLGVCEREVINNIIAVTNRLIEQERELRCVYTQRDNKVEDVALRAYGIMTNARRMSSDEFMKLYSDLRMGVASSYINGIDYASLNKLMIDVQPGSLQQKEKNELSAEQRDTLRAQVIRETLTEIMNRRGGS